MGNYLIYLLILFSLTGCFSKSSKTSSANNVSIVNDSPVALNITPPAFNEDVSTTINLDYSDTEGDQADSCVVENLVDIIITSPCTCVSGQCSVGVVSSIGYSGPAEFSFTISTGSVSSNSALASLTILPVQDVPSVTYSTISASGPVIADGQSTSTITITLLDQDQLPVVGEIPTFSATDSGGTNSYTACSATNASGISTCTMKSTRAELKTIELTSPIQKTGDTVSFVPGASSSSLSTIVASGSPIANGVDKSVVTITLKDAFGNAVYGVTPTYGVSGTGNIIGSCSVSNAAGLSSCEVSSTKAERKGFNLLSPVIVTGNELDFNTAGIDLQVPIELLNMGVYSLSVDTIYVHSQTSLNTADYVADTNTYFFEIVAENTNATNSYNVSLVNSSGTEIPDSIISIPAATSSMKRFRVTWTPVSGENTYRLKIPATAAQSNVIVHSAKIIVEQKKATATKLHFPLTAYNPTGHVNNSSFIHSGGTYGTSTANLSSRFYTWTRDDSKYDSIVTSNAWTFEAIGNVALEASQIGQSASWMMALFNSTTGQKISESEVTSSTKEMKKISFNKDVTGFSNGDKIELRIDKTNGTPYVIKAALWLKLNFLKKAEVYTRIGNKGTNTVTALMPDYRFLWEASAWSNPQIFLKSFSSNATTSVSLLDVGIGDTSTSGTVVSGSTLTSPATYSQVSSSGLSLINNHSYILRHELNSPDGSTQMMGGAFIAIQVSE